MDNELTPIPVRGQAMEISGVPGMVNDGIYVGHADGNVVIMLSSGGEGKYATLSGDMLDHVAGLIDDAICAATRAEAPSLGSMQ